MRASVLVALAAAASAFAPHVALRRAAAPRPRTQTRPMSPGSGFLRMATIDATPAKAPTVEEYVEGRGGSRPIKKVLIANNGMAATKSIMSMRQWAYLELGDEKAIEFVAMATPEDLKVRRLREQHVPTVLGRQRSFDSLAAAKTSMPPSPRRGPTFLAVAGLASTALPACPPEPRNRWSAALAARRPVVATGERSPEEGRARDRMLEEGRPPTGAPGRPAPHGDTSTSPSAGRSENRRFQRRP
jgi:hypothetical protein